MVDTEKTFLKNKKSFYSDEIPPNTEVYDLKIKQTLQKLTSKTLYLIHVLNSIDQPFKLPSEIPRQFLKNLSNIRIIFKNLTKKLFKGNETRCSAPKKKGGSEKILDKSSLENKIPPKSPNSLKYLKNERSGPQLSLQPIVKSSVQQSLQPNPQQSLQLSLKPNLQPNSRPNLRLNLIPNLQSNL